MPLSALPVCLLPVMKTLILMAGVQEAKPILQFLMAAVQIMQLSKTFVLPASKQACL